MEATLPASLENAITAWNRARHAVQDEPCMENRNGYEVSTNQLGQAISQWRTEQPDLFEQFGFWFESQWSD